MTQALFALAGVMVGIAGQLIASMLTSRREDARAELNWQETRDARLFEHRRKAYTDFIAAVESMVDEIGRARSEGHSLLPEEYDPVHKHLAGIWLYGTEDASSAAARVLGALVQHDRTREGYEGAHRLAFDFAERVRGDLGVRN